MLGFIRWRVIYPVDSAIHRLNNWGQNFRVTQLKNNATVTYCRFYPLNVTHSNFISIQILLPAFNFSSQSLKLSDECGPIISDHTKQHCRNKRWLLLKPERLWNQSHNQCSSIKWIERSTKYILHRIQAFTFQRAYVYTY